jgi:glycoprotein 2-beta-D-xylosyltransferase
MLPPSSFSADESKYGRIPLSVRKRFERLQFIAFLLLAGLVLILLTSDGLLLKYGDGTRRVNTLLEATSSKLVHDDPSVRLIRRGVRIPLYSQTKGAILNINKQEEEDEVQEDQPRLEEKEKQEEISRRLRIQQMEEAGRERDRMILEYEAAEKAAAAAAAQAASSSAKRSAIERKTIEDRKIKAEAIERERLLTVTRALEQQKIESASSTVQQKGTWTDVNDNPSSCNGFFGNGYSDKFDIYKSSSSSGGLVKCRGHPTILAMNCELRSVIMHSDKIEMSIGGETLNEVMGRSEEQEVPIFNLGAFEVLESNYESVATSINPDVSLLDGSSSNTNSESTLMGSDLLKRNAPRIDQWLKANDKFKFDFLEKLLVLKGEQKRVCSLRVEAPVIFVTRMEYANLFHTSTDWYNVWSAAKLAGLEPTMKYKVEKLTSRSLVTPFIDSPKFPAHIVFLDGHNAGPMDQGWLSLFLSVSYAKHFSGPTCFDHLIYAPFGYVAAISAGIGSRHQDCRTNPYIRAFSDDFVLGLGITPRKTSTCADDGPAKVVFVQRTHYLAHPRHNGKIVRRLDNEDEIMQALQAQTSNIESGVMLLRGDYASMSITEQVKSVQDACVIAGAHGAGLSHVLFAPPNIHMLEIQPPSFVRPHFIAYSFWSGAHHHTWSIESSIPPVHTVVSRVLETAQHAVMEAKAEGGVHGEGREKETEHPLHGG